MNGSELFNLKNDYLIHKDEFFYFVEVTLKTARFKYSNLTNSIYN